MLFAGLVFLAFAFNLVDCGGLLGSRLSQPKPSKAKKAGAASKATHLSSAASVSLPVSKPSLGPHSNYTFPL